MWLAALVIGLAAPAAFADAWARGDVRAFGAVGDGQTDDTAAIQKAVDTAQQGTVYLPPGVYRITAPITLRPGLTLDGGADQGRAIGS
jgi:polygalacturonase